MGCVPQTKLRELEPEPEVATVDFGSALLHIEHVSASSSTRQNELDRNGVGNPVNFQNKTHCADSGFQKQTNYVSYLW